VGSLAAIAYLLKLSGFCFDQRDWKSDRELIEAAFRHELNSGWSNTPAISDVDAYLRGYPQCCSVGESGPLSSGDLLLNALFGRRFYTVRITYPVTNPGGEPYYRSILVMDCCGEYIPDSYGTGTSIPVPKGPAPPIPRRLGQ
jgi:hypothetical protein